LRVRVSSLAFNKDTLIVPANKLGLDFMDTVSEIL
jgi:hypothetical protein